MRGRALPRLILKDDELKELLDKGAATNPETSITALAQNGTQSDAIVTPQPSNDNALHIDLDDTDSDLVKQMLAG